jgi:hypothetical protein
MEMLLKSVMRIIDLHKPIRKAWILDLGDDVQGENMFQGTTITACDINVYDQVYGLACPVQARFCASLLQEVEEVEVVKVPGNHGNYQKVQPAGTNWDRFLGKALKDSLVNNPKIKVRMTGDFCDLVTIQGFRFFIMHGDQVMAQQGIPLFALRRKYQEYFALYQFHYAYNGHFHAGYHDQVNSVADYTGCPPLVTGDEWALKKIGRASKPVQLCFGVHPRKGRSFNYTLHTDSDYLPRPDFK